MASDYHGETPDSMLAQLEAVRGKIEAGITRAELLKLLPIGGARNAVDAALWDLESKRTGRRAWDLAGVGNTREIASAMTIGIRSIEGCKRGRSRPDALSLDQDQGEQRGSARLRIEAVRRGAPNSRLIVDAEPGLGRVDAVFARSQAAQVAMDLLEQPSESGWR